VQIDQIDPTAAVIYPILFDDRLKVIVHLPQQPLRQYTINIPQEKVKSPLAQLISSINPSAAPSKPTSKQLKGSLRIIERPRSSVVMTKDFLPRSQQVYNWLIKPAEVDLAKSKVKTLVFVMDGSFRNLPLAALHDGKQFLIEKYGIAVTPSLQLVKTQPSERRPLRVLLGGVSEARQRIESGRFPLG
jgi:CHAT domain-containing protein